MLRASAVFSLLVLLSIARANEFISPDIVHLTSSNYTDQVNDGKVYFVMFYASWCGYCRRLAPIWKDLASDLKDSTTIAIAHVDCDQDLDTCLAIGVPKYPTLKVVHKGEEIGWYREERYLTALKAFIEEAANQVTKEL